MPKTPTWSQEKYLKAFLFAAKAHRGQKYSGSDLPYMMHFSFVCMETIAALEVEEIESPDLAVQCALLHDVIEDTNVGEKRLREVFGDEITDGVLLLTKNKKSKDSCEPFAEYIKQMEEAPIEIKMVKLADRISNLQEPPFHWSKAKICSYLKESNDISEKFGDASPYLNERLMEKIKEYSKYSKRN